MIIDYPILSQTFIAGEFVRIWYPSQPKTCHKCLAEGHNAATCSSQSCLNCEQLGHCSDDGPLPPLCRVCFADLHPTSQCPFTYYSSNILSVKVITASYAKAAEKGKEVVEGKQQQAQKEKLSKRA